MYVYPKSSSNTLFFTCVLCCFFVTRDNIILIKKKKGLDEESIDFRLCCNILDKHNCYSYKSNIIFFYYLICHIYPKNMYISILKI